jgi:putative restriction endonuclease
MCSMVKAVLTTKIDPTYDDLPEQRYHFPQTYLRQVEAAVGDWIVYYEPRRSSAELSSRGGRQSYFATARVTTIDPDPIRPDHFYARIADYLDFDRAVPFREGARYYESGLQRVDGGTSKGAFGRAVRTIRDGEFDQIVRAGFAKVLAEPARAEFPPLTPLGDLADEPASFERPIIERVVTRPFRDAVFAGSVKNAYRDTCAMTGVKIINGGGRSEVQAAHIRPVAAAGPDSIRNGIALCATLHWMFDRGLVSVGDDHSLLLAPGKIPGAIVRLVNPDRRLMQVDRPDQMPHPQFLRWHREHVYKG